MRYVVVPIFVHALGAGAAYYIAGRGAPPAIKIVQPAAMIGAASSF